MKFSEILWNYFVIAGSIQLPLLVTSGQTLMGVARGDAGDAGAPPPAGARISSKFVQFTGLTFCCYTHYADESIINYCTLHLKLHCVPKNVHLLFFPITLSR